MSKVLSTGYVRLAALLIVCLLATGCPPVGSSAEAGVAPSGVVASGPAGTSIVALIFNGGPGPNTVRFVQELRALLIPATFFFSGDSLAQDPSDARDVKRSGSEIGGSSYSEVDLQSLSTPQVVAEISRGQTVFRRTLGLAPIWFQPPYGDVDARVAGIISSLGLRTVTWSINSNDLTSPNPAQIIETVRSGVTGGSIVLFHDEGGNPNVTLAALAKLVADLKYRGFRFGTLDQLFGLAKLPPCVPNERRLFESSGIHQAAGPIYQFWLSRLCRGISLGPATSLQSAAKDGVISQNFAQTGRQIAYNPSTGSVRIVLMWSWGSKIFSSKKIKPKYGDPITRAWFARYFAGDDEGPALTAEHTYGKVVAQRFVHGWAVESAKHVVSWESNFRTKA